MIKLICFFLFRLSHEFGELDLILPELRTVEALRDSRKLSMYCAANAP